MTRGSDSLMKTGHFKIGDLVKFVDADDSELAEKRNIRGRVVMISCHYYLRIAWYEDASCQKSIGVDSTYRKPDNIIKAE